MTNFINSVVSPESSITDAVLAINKGGIRIAVIVDEAMRLKGVVTDGDIRRALLAHIDFKTSVSTIMNANPCVVPVGTSPAEIMAIMKEKSILHLPVVDDQNRLIFIETFEHVIDAKAPKSSPVFLMAGGFGTRLRPLTNSIPKVMLKVGSKPILETILLGFIEHGFSEFYISVFYLADQIKQHFGDGSKWGVNIYYVEEENPLGTGGSLSLLPGHINEPLIIMNGDLLTRVNFNSLLNFHNSHGAAATMCVREYTMEVPYGVIESSDIKITSIVEKPKQHYFVNAGIYVLSPEVFKQLPKDKHKDMPDLFNDLIKAQQNVFMFPVHEYWLDIGRLGDFEQAQQDVMNIFS
ncbi:MAG: CBS domain-containing protein [Chitinophagaceae bacterium]|nr:MAG: CBS domain-containing protein [Chitinophagaceae bacterium]